MGKDKNSKKGASGNRQTTYKIIIFIVVALGASVAAAFLLTGGPEKSKLSVALGGEKRTTLSPNYFIGKQSKAYRVAKEIPEVLDKVYCYCECQKNFGHKSLLTCFVDKHGSKCGICMNEALMAYDLNKKGYDTKSIVDKIDSYFSH